MRKHLLTLWQKALRGWYCRVVTPCEVHVLFPLMGLADWLTAEVPDRLKRRKPVLVGAELLEKRWLMTTVSFSAATYSVTETAGKVTITVNLDQSPSQQVTVQYATSDGTASSSSDYKAASGTLTFPAFQGTQKTFDVYITDDDVSESNETVNLTLSNPTNATLGSPSTATLTINNASPTTWLATGQQRSSDPLEGQFVPFGTSSVGVQTGDLRVVQPLDFDQSPGTTVGGSPALVYHSDTVNVLPILEATVPSYSSDGLPTQIKAQLTWNNGTPQSWVTFSTTGHFAGDSYALAIQVNSAVTSTGQYPYSLHVIASFSNRGDVDRTVSGNANIIANGSSDAFGYGWTLAGLDQLVSVSGGVVWVAGSGGNRYFASAGGGNFTSPANDFGTLVQNGDSSYTYTDIHQNQYKFDSGGKLTAVVDPHSLALTYSYSSGRLTEVDSPDGGRATLTYDGNNLLQTVVEPGGRTVTLSHSGGDLTGVTTPDGALRTFSYDGSHRLTNEKWGPLNTTYSYDSTTSSLTSIDRGLGSTLTITAAAVQGLATSPAKNSGDAVAVLADALNQKTTYTLDGVGRPTTEKTPDGGTWNWSRNTAGQVTSTSNSAQPSTNYSYSGADLTGITYPDNSKASYQYDSTYHKPTVVIDTLSRRTTLSYNGSGDLTTVKDALSQVTTLTWSNGLLQSIKDALGNVTTMEYDTSRRLTDMIDALGNRTTYSYDGAGNPQTVKDALGRVTTTAYDVMNRLTAVTDAAGDLTTMAYNGPGLVTGRTDPLGNRDAYNYDQRGFLTSVTEAVGSGVQRTTTLAYDTLGNPTTRTDPLSHVSTYSYDAMDRVRTVTNPVGAVQTYSYDLAGELTAYADPLNHTTTLSYSNRGWRTTIQDALGNVTTSAYDTEGNVTNTIDARGDKTTYSYDALNRVTQVKDPLGNLATVAYDTVGNVTGSIDQRGNRTTYSYDALNRLTQVKDAVGNLATVLYDTVGNVTTSIDPRGNRTTFAYDVIHRLTQRTDALGNLATVGYDADSNVTNTVDPRGDRTTFAYDALNRLTQTKDALGNLATVAYDLADNVTTSIDQLGRRTTFAYDGADRLTKTTDALSNVTTAAYDLADNVTTVINPLGNRTTYTYDALNHLKTKKDPLGNVTTLAYDAATNLTSVTNPRGYATTYAYDALNRPTQTTDALGNLATTVYDAAGNVTTTIDQLGRRTTMAYDADNRPTAVTDPLSHTVTTTYDAAGNVTKLTDALGYNTTLSYDALNRQTSVQDPGGGIATTVYDTAGNVTNWIDQLGNKTTYTYDVLNRRTAATDSRGGITTTAYDAVDNVTNLIDSVGNKTTYVYDSLDRITQITDPFGKSSTFSYDAASRMTSTTDRLNRRRDLTYDNADRLTNETWVASGSTQNLLTYSYDANDNLLSAANYNGTYTMSYDAIDRVTVEQEPFALTLTSTYDAVGNRTQLQDSFGGLMTSVYDNADRLTTRKYSGQSTNLREDLTYTARDQIETETRYSDLSGTTKVGSTTYTYDAAERLTNLQHRNSGGSLLANFTYTYDLASRVTTEVLNGTTTTYSYDAINQLTNDSATTYTYDLNGNRNMTGYATTTGNRMTSDGTWTYTYDDEGNITKKSKGANAETWTYGYDNENHLIWIEKRATDGGTLLMRADYKYDVFGNRIEKAVDDDGAGPHGTTTTRVGYDGSDVWVDMDGSNALQTRRLYLDAVDSVFARISSGGTAAWYLPDRLGSIRNIVDSTGALIDTIAYDGFGVVTSESNSANGDRYKWTGRERDGESGLQLNGERFYDPKVARWLSQDPLGLRPDPNPYRYVGNDATNVVDPFGLEGMPGQPNMAAGNQRPADAFPEDIRKFTDTAAKALRIIAAGISSKRTGAQIAQLLDAAGTDSGDDPRVLPGIAYYLQNTDVAYGFWWWQDDVKFKPKPEIGTEQWLQAFQGPPGGPPIVWGVPYGADGLTGPEALAAAADMLKKFATEVPLNVAMVGSMFITGPEDVIIAVALKGGFRVLKGAGGRIIRILTQDGKQLSAIEARALAQEARNLTRSMKDLGFPNRAFKFKGAMRIDSLRHATHADILKAFEGTGLTPTNHFIMRIKDPRLAGLGIHTFQDLEAVLRAGVPVLQNDGTVALVHGQVAFIIDPKTKTLITVTPWR